MNNPYGIPEDIWETAVMLIRTDDMYDDSEEVALGIRENVALAILSERTKAAEMLEKEAVRLNDLAGNPTDGMTNEDQGRAWDFANDLMALSQAIRKGGKE
jgi:hypothetical protein